jgi:hypothetical protein
MIESRWRLSNGHEADNAQDQMVSLERCFVDVSDGVTMVDSGVRIRLHRLRAEGLRAWAVGSENGF